MKEQNSISVVICCFNSAKRIEKTLLALSKQILALNNKLEILLIDNNSTDNTAQIAQKYYNNLNAKFNFKIIKELQPGKVNAIKTGVLNALYEYVLFVDDDNELDETYAQTVIKLFSKNKNVGVIGGSGKLPQTSEFENLPVWWNFVKIAFAIRSEKEKITKTVAGAGMGIRKSCYLKLLKYNFKFKLSGRKGSMKITSGSDYEICYAIQLLGFDVLFSPKLSFIHNIEINRIDFEYMKKLYFGFGLTNPYMQAYENVLNSVKVESLNNTLKKAIIKLFFNKISIALNKIGILKNKKYKNILTCNFNKGRVEILKKIDKTEFNTFVNNIRVIKKTT